MGYLLQNYSRTDAIKLIHSYMSNRWTKTKINKSFSFWSALRKGLPERSVLGPVSFNIYSSGYYWSLKKVSALCRCSLYRDSIQKRIFYENKSRVDL